MKELKSTKICNNCKGELPRQCFRSKGVGKLNPNCKVCEHILNKKFTCEIPPNTKLCKTCNEIKENINYKKSASCNTCRRKEKPVKIERTEKQCKVCLDVFPVSNFYLLKTKIGSQYPTTACKQCFNRKREENRKGKRVLTERKLLANKIRRIENKSNTIIDKEKNRAKKYGLTLEELNNMITVQNNKCYICGKAGEDNVNGKLVIDHCHNSNKVRKLLCSYCNTSIGQTKEDLEYINKLIDYLKEHDFKK